MATKNPLTAALLAAAVLFSAPAQAGGLFGMSGSKGNGFGGSDKYYRSAEKAFGGGNLSRVDGAPNQSDLSRLEREAVRKMETDMNVMRNDTQTNSHDPH